MLGKIAVSLFSLIILIPSCNTTEPPPPEPEKKLTLSVEDISTSKAWLKLSTENITIPVTISLNQNEQLRETIDLNNTDTLIYIDALQLNTTYIFEAISENIKSNKLSVTTFDTTSHNYNWEITTIGEFQSVLRDVWGTDENNVYAVGGLRINGQAVGILKWDGTSWTPQNNQGGFDAIYGFSENDIWVVGGGVFHFDGVEWEQKDSKLVNGHIEVLDSVLHNNTDFISIWGTSSSNLYLGSSGRGEYGNGKIIHWDGEKASVVYTYTVDGQSGIVDIYGISENDIFAAGMNDLPATDILLHFDGISWKPDNTIPSFPFKIYTVLSFNINETILGGTSVYFGGSGNWTATNFPFSLVWKIRGKAANDLFGVGSFGSVSHYNGEQWKFYDELYTPAGGRYRGVFATGDKVFIVGSSDDGITAKIIIGTKQGE